VMSLVEPYFVARYLLPVTPAACILLAVALAALPRRLGVAAHIGLVALLTVSVLRLWDHPRQGWAAVVDHVVSVDPEGAILFADPELRVPFEHALITSDVDHDLMPIAPPYEWGGLPRYLPEFSLDDAGPILDDAHSVWIVDWGHAEGSDPLGGRIAGVIDHPALNSVCPVGEEWFDG